jgi:hypothetical protein
VGGGREYFQGYKDAWQYQMDRERVGDVGCAIRNGVSRSQPRQEQQRQVSKEKKQE